MEFAYSWIFGVFMLIVGLCLGSFLNVCIHRLPTGKSLIWPGSHCPACMQPIHWYDNIPVISYLVLRGRCRHCEAEFSARYMLVELATGLLLFGYWLAYFKLGVRTGVDHLAVYAAHMVLVACLLVSGVIDLERKEIYPAVTNFALVVGIGMSLAWPVIQRVGLADRSLPPVTGWLHTNAAVAAAVGAAVGGAVVYLTRVVATQAFKKEAMGIGDVYLMVAVGGVLGWQAVLLTFFLAPFLALPYGVWQLVRAGKEADSDEDRAGEQLTRPPMPWGSFLCTVAGVTLLLAARAGWDGRGQVLLALAFVGFGAAVWFAGRERTVEMETETEPPRAPESHEVPYGPFLAAAAGGVMLAQDAVLDYLFQLN